MVLVAVVDNLSVLDMIVVAVVVLVVVDLDCLIYYLTFAYSQLLHYVLSVFARLYLPTGLNLICPQLKLLSLFCNTGLILHHLFQKKLYLQNTLPLSFKGAYILKPPRRPHFLH